MKIKRIAWRETMLLVLIMTVACASSTLFDAARTQAASLLDKGADVNAKNENGVTALMLAREPAIVQALLDRGAKKK